VSLRPAEGPLHGYELMHLRSGRILVRRTSRYTWIMMWLSRRPSLPIFLAKTMDSS
jgi:hypothetical protein